MAPAGLAERLAAYETKPTEGKTWEEFDQKFLVTCGGNRGMLTNLDPNNPVFYWARGHAYDENANKVGAIENYTKAISLMSSNSSTLITYGGKSINLIDLYEDRASSYETSGKYDNAVLDLRNVLRLTQDPEKRKETINKF